MEFRRDVLPRLCIAIIIRPFINGIQQRFTKRLNRVPLFYISVKLFSREEGIHNPIQEFDLGNADIHGNPQRVPLQTILNIPVASAFCGHRTPAALRRVQFIPVQLNRILVRLQEYAVDTVQPYHG